MTDWNATDYFKRLTSRNKLARRLGFRTFKVSDLMGFGEALTNAQTCSNFVCVSEVDDGYTEIENTPHIRRVKTVFLAMRYPIDNEGMRKDRFDTMHELFRQFMSDLIREKIQQEQNNIYIDTRVNFKEIDKYFFTGCACAYYTIATTNYLSLAYDTEEWEAEDEGAFDKRFTEELK